MRERIRFTPSSQDSKTKVCVGEIKRRRRFPRARGEGKLRNIIYQLACRLHEQAPKGEVYLNSPQKRAIDMVGLSFLAIPGALTILAEASYVFLCDQVWPFYTLPCVGKDGETFGRLKIKTMIEGASEMLGYEIPMASKSPNDPRVTHRRLRTTSLDEIPQLLNVLKGEMSLVGPVGRPLSEFIHFRRLADQQPKLEERVSGFSKSYPKAKPGITGLYQIMGRSNLTAEETLLIEGWYLENASWVVDLGVLWGTISAVRSKHGAF